MEYGEAYEALKELVESEKYDELRDETSKNSSLTPDVEVFADRAVFYVQVADEFRGEYERKVLGEYREGELTPVQFDEALLERQLQGRGEVEIDETMLEPRDVNFSEQRHHAER